MTIKYSYPLKKKGDYYKSNDATIITLDDHPEGFSDIRALGQKLVSIIKTSFPFRFHKVYDHYYHWELNKNFEEVPTRGYVTVRLSRWRKRDLEFSFDINSPKIYVYQEKHSEYFGTRYVWKLSKEKLKVFMKFLEKVEASILFKEIV